MKLFIHVFCVYFPFPKALKKSSAGWDGISAKILKEIIEVIAEPTVYVFNLSLASGRVPNELKLARVVAIFKADDPMQFSNYRPVSVLPVLSKVLERLVYNRLTKFISENNILYNLQFGFREKHSCDLTLITLTENSQASCPKNPSAADGILISREDILLIGKSKHEGIVLFLENRFNNRQ